jgi:hypothetical protein
MGVRVERSMGVSGDFGRFILDNKPCRNVPLDSAVATDIRRSSSGRRVEVDPGVTILS